MNAALNVNQFLLSWAFNSFFHCQALSPGKCHHTAKLRDVHSLHYRPQKNAFDFFRSEPASFVFLDLKHICMSQRNDFSWTPYNTYVCRKNKWFGGTKLKKKKRKKTENFPETERQWSKNVSEALHMHKATFQPLIKKTWRQTQNRCSRLQYASVTVNKSWTLLNYTKHWEQGLC